MAALPSLDPELERRLVQVLEQARQQGFLGPGAAMDHVEHALDLAQRIQNISPARALDLGSGGGVPGLILLSAFPHLTMVLLDAQQRRSTFLRHAVTELGFDGRVEVVAARAEEAGRRPGLRGSFDVVVARSFGPPATTAECAAPFLRVGGHLFVSEPPGGPERWPVDGLAELGLVLEHLHGGPQGNFHYAQFQARMACGDRFPRRDGVPAKRPLFSTP